MYSLLRISQERREPISVQKRGVYTKPIFARTGVLNHLKHSFNDLRLIGGYQHARSEPRLHAASVSSASMATLAAAETARAAAGSGGSGLLGTSLDGGCC